MFFNLNYNADDAPLPNLSLSLLSFLLHFVFFPLSLKNKNKQMHTKQNLPSAHLSLHTNLFPGLYHHLPDLGCTFLKKNQATKLHVAGQGKQSREKRF